MFCTPGYDEKKGELNLRKCNLTCLRVMRAGNTYYLVTSCTCTDGNLGLGELLFNEKARPPRPVCVFLCDRQTRQPLRVIRELASWLALRLWCSTVLTVAQDINEPFGEYAKGLAPCACARALCVALNVGEPMQRCEVAALERLLHSTGAGQIDAASLEQGVLRVQLQLGGEEALVLKLHNGEWGLLTHYLPTDSEPMRCLMCPQPLRCSHVSAMDSGEVGSAQSSMPQQAYVSMMEKHLDPATGRERVTSISEHRVPEELPMDDDRGCWLGDGRDQARIIQERMTGGSQLPSSCRATELGPRPPCSCGDGWEDAAPHDFIVFGVANAKRAVWRNLLCPFVP